MTILTKTLMVLKLPSMHLPMLLVLNTFKMDAVIKKIKTLVRVMNDMNLNSRGER